MLLSRTLIFLYDNCYEKRSVVLSYDNVTHSHAPIFDEALFCFAIMRIYINLQFAVHINQMQNLNYDWNIFGVFALVLPIHLLMRFPKKMHYQHINISTQYYHKHI